MNDTSLSLLDRARRTSDAESWNRLVCLYRPLLDRWVRRYGVQDSDADDIVQEVLAVVLSELPRFQHNQRKGAFRSWLRAILVNRLREFWRARRYRPLATGTSSLDEKLHQLEHDGSRLSQIWNQEHDQHVLKRLLATAENQFEPRTWQAFRRQVIEGDRPTVVALELNMSLSSVYTAKYRVLNALRRESEGLIQDICHSWILV